MGKKEGERENLPSARDGTPPPRRRAPPPFPPAPLARAATASGSLSPLLALSSARNRGAEVPIVRQGARLGGAAIGLQAPGAEGREERGDARARRRGPSRPPLHLHLHFPQTRENARTCCCCAARRHRRAAARPWRGSMAPLWDWLRGRVRACESERAGPLLSLAASKSNLLAPGLLLGVSARSREKDCSVCCVRVARVGTS